MNSSVTLRPSIEKRTLGQVAFEADRENAIRGHMRVLIPTWDKLPKSIQVNWEVMAKRIAQAIATEMPEVLQDLSGDVIEVESVEEKKCLPLLTSS